MSHLPALPAWTTVLGMGRRGRPVVLHMDRPQTWSVVLHGAEGASATPVLYGLLGGLAVTTGWERLRVVEAAIGGRPAALAGMSPAGGPVRHLWGILEQAARGRRREHILVLADGLDRLAAVGRGRGLEALEALLEEGPGLRVHLLAATGARMPVRLQAALQREGLLRGVLSPAAGGRNERRRRAGLNLVDHEDEPITPVASSPQELESFRRGWQTWLREARAA